MKVLFICSGNSNVFDVPPFIKAQADSLTELGNEVDFFKIKGKGVSGYIKKIHQLRKFLRGNTYDIIHAHYVLSGWVAIISLPGIPIVLSLMGTDAYGEYTGKNKVELKSRFIMILTFLIQPFVKAIISKSNQIEKYVYRKKISHVIPNGVSLEFFNPGSYDTRKELGLEENKKHILFLGDVNYKRKNFELTENAVHLLRRNDVELITPYPVSHEKVVKYLNATDVFITTAFIEGSSNVIKEAMACNCPIVTTDAGDARWVLGETAGCYITSFEVEDVAEKIEKALHFSSSTGRTNGRERIKRLGLDTETVAYRLWDVYNLVLDKKLRGS